jgi:hypothetical protein
VGLLKQVRFWPIASVSAVQRHVRSWPETGSGWPIAKVSDYPSRKMRLRALL